MLLIPSPLGLLRVLADARGIFHISLAGPDEGAESLATPIQAAFAAYFAGHSSLALPYYLTHGTPLQQRVWRALGEIPYGSTLSYSELAERVGKPHAIRAVASACGANPLPLLLPCHRVVAKNGGLGGYSLGGLAAKRILLALEANLSVPAGRPDGCNTAPQPQRLLR